MIPWTDIETTALSRFEEALCNTRQSPVYHEEGDVYIHTMIACDALMRLPEYQHLNERQQHILYVATMLHDIGKIPTTVFEDGDWRTPHHAPTGSRMARELLWKEYGLCGQKELVDDTVGRVIPLMQDEESSLNSREFPQQEVKLYAAAIKEILVDDARYGEMSTACRDRIVNGFSSENL